MVLRPAGDGPACLALETISILGQTRAELVELPYLTDLARAGQAGHTLPRLNGVCRRVVHRACPNVGRATPGRIFPANVMGGRCRWRRRGMC
jgi:hypothetical protein